MKRKIVYALLATLISIGLWLYVVTVVNPEYEDTFYNIQVSLQNDEILRERGLMVVSDEIPTVTLKLAGNRSDMIKLNSSNITLKADLSRIHSAGEQELEYTITYPDGVPTNAFSVVSQTKLTVSVTDWKSKEVEVQVVHGDSKVPDSYQQLRPKLDYEKITVTGPVSVIDRIEVAQIDIDLTGKTSTIFDQFEYVLRDKDGAPVESKWVKANANTVQVDLKIYPKKQVNVSFDVIEGDGLQKENFDISWNILGEQTVEIYGFPNEIANTTAVTIGKIDLNAVKLDANGTYTYTETFDIISAENADNGLWVTDKEGKLEVQITIKRIVTSTFTVSNIKAVNKPSGSNLKVSTRQAEVVLRGPQDLVKAVRAGDITIEVDCSQKDSSGKYPVTVKLPEKFSKLEAVNKDTISIVVTQG